MNNAVQPFAQSAFPVFPSPLQCLQGLTAASKPLCPWTRDGTCVVINQ